VKMPIVASPDRESGSTSEKSARPGPAPSIAIASYS
jgi:hypothetical protein